MLERKVAIVIDDEEFIRKTLSKMLKKLGYTTKAFPSALDLWDTHKKQPIFDKAIPDAIFVDIVLPGMTGIEFLQNIKDYKIEKAALMSGHFWGDDLKKKADDLNCKHFEKPFTFEQIEEWLKE